ncbi:MAG: hypothetical protein RL272_857 [Candidatus Parcubacteria bacterium]|jgi:predicted  nucleic acid-binding Zn-ribbon protein
MHNPRVHGFVAWSAILTFGVVSFTPAILFAQMQTPDFNGQFPPGGMQEQTDACRAKCRVMMDECMSKAAQDQAAIEACKGPVQACFLGCQNGAPAMMPPQPPQGAFPPGGFDGQPQDQGSQGSAMQQKGAMMQQAGFDQMKRQIGSFVRQMARIKNRVAALERKGVKAPQELTDALAKADEAAASINAAAAMDDLGDPAEIMGALQDAAQIVQDTMPDLERMANLPRIYARIDKQLKSFDRQLASDMKAAANSKVDLSQAVAGFQAELDKVKAAYADAKAKIASGDVEGGFDALQSDVFDGFDDVGQAHAAIQQLRQMQAALKQGARELAQFQKELDRLKKKGKDVSEAQATLDEGKAKFDELKGAAAAKPFDADKAIDIIGGLQDVRDAFMTQLNGLKGIQEQDEIDAGLSPMKLDISGFGDFGGMMGQDAGRQTPNTSFGEKQLPPGAGAEIVVQAESGALGGSVGSMTLMGKTSATPDTHGGYLYLGDGGATASYSAEAPAAGAYALWIRFSDDGKHPDGARAASVAVNDAVLTWSNASADTHGWVYVKVGTVTLKKGTNAVMFSKLATTSAAFVMDDFILSPDPSFQPK